MCALILVNECTGESFGRLWGKTSLCLRRWWPRTTLPQTVTCFFTFQQDHNWSCCLCSFCDSERKPKGLGKFQPRALIMFSCWTNATQPAPISLSHLISWVLLLGDKSNLNGYNVWLYFYPSCFSELFQAYPRKYNGVVTVHMWNSKGLKI